MHHVCNQTSHTKEITQSISSGNSCVSVVIPFVRALRKHLESSDESDKGIRTMKASMLDSLTNCYSDVESKEALVLASILDPCFKVLSAEFYFHKPITVHLELYLFYCCIHFLLYIGQY